MRRRLLGLFGFGVLGTVLYFAVDWMTAKSEVDPIGSPIEWLETGESIAPAIPKNQIPDYTVLKFDSNSVRKNVRQWRILSKTAHLYNPQNILHLKEVDARLFAADGTTTFITGKEARLSTVSDQIELFGDVRARFSDGSIVESDYMRFFSDRQRLEIPTSHLVKGKGQTQEDKGTSSYSFTSQGLIYAGNADDMLLPQRVRFEIRRSIRPTHTVIVSDRARLNRKIKKVTFAMDRPKTYVTLAQTDFFMRSRWMDAFYGAEKDRIHFLVAHDEVYFQEGDDENKVRYGTCGLAQFDAHRNVIFLTKFPQVYENNDTMTGEKIIVDRDQDIVEIDYSNAYNAGPKEGSRK